MSSLHGMLQILGSSLFSCVFVRTASSINCVFVILGIVDVFFAAAHTFFPQKNVFYLRKKKGMIKQLNLMA